MTEFYRLRNAPKDVVKSLVKISDLEAHLVQNVLFFSKCLVKHSTKRIDWLIFSTVLRIHFDLYDEQFTKRLFLRTCEKTKDLGMTAEDFAKIVCTLITDNLDLKIDYTFAMYNYTDSGLLDHTEVLTYIQGISCITDTEEADRQETRTDINRMVLDVLGLSKEDHLSLEDFRAKVKENILVLQILGTCLPSREATARFKEAIEGQGWRELSKKFLTAREDLLIEEHHTTLNEKYYPILLDMYTM